MSKAILVIDMPDSCNECCLHNYHFCDVIGDCIDKYMYDINEKDKPSWCPLKEVPEKKEYYIGMDENSAGVVDGWNWCLEEILGE